MLDVKNNTDTLLKSLAGLALAAACALFAARADAKVAFTGYGDIRLTADADSEIEATPAILGAFGITDTTLRSRGARLENIGIFATTNVSEHLDFLMDVTYREIGTRPNELRLQYAYLHYAPGLYEAKVGRFMLPFGYLNEQQFYSFQRVSVTPPVFHSGILGLPISDAGVAAASRLEAGPVVLAADVYGVNGYGNTSGSTASFRNASIGGTLVIANNIGSRDVNSRTALGGRLRVLSASGKSEAGVSYYSGHWDPAGNNLFTMGNAHVHADVAGLDVLSEALVMKTENDAGFVPAVGHPDWKTFGYFVTASYHGVKVMEKPVIPWARYEDYSTRPDGGGAGKEKLRSTAGGVTVMATESVALKLEASKLDYLLPLPAFGGNIGIDVMTYLVGLSFTF